MWLVRMCWLEALAGRPPGVRPRLPVRAVPRSADAPTWSVRARGRADADTRGAIRGNPLVRRRPPRRGRRRFAESDDRPALSWLRPRAVGRSSGAHARI